MRAIAIAASVLLAIPAVAEEEPGFEFYASVYGYDAPDDDYLQPSVTADRGALHLEARYNYEDASTTSVWGGWNFEGGETVSVEGTLMAGLVAGATDGVAPGFRVALSWSKLELFTEGEYLFDADDSSSNFFYAWSELTWAPAEWCRFGIVGQRTKAYETERDIQRGVLVGFSVGRVDLTTYVFNPDDDETTWVAAIGVSF